MLSPRIARSARRQRSIGPRLELLEDRRLLASKPALVTISEMASGSSDILIITGTSKNDSIFIADNGQATAGSVVVAAGGGVSYTAQHAISAIEVFTGPGKDSLTYELQGDLKAGASEFLFATSGGKLPSMLKATPGGGSLRVTADIAGKIPTTSELEIITVPDGKAATTLNATATGEVDGKLVAAISSLTGTMGTAGKKVGALTFNFNSSSTIGPAGSINVGAIGGASQNLLDTNYSGINNGSLAVTETGSGAKDFITASIAMTATSTGTIGTATAPAEIGSGGKNAKNRFVISRGADSSGTAGINAEVVAAPKKGVVVRTKNVRNMTQATDSIVS